MGIPCWYIPIGNGKGVLKEGLITERGTKVRGKKITLKSLLVKKRIMSFGKRKVKRTVKRKVKRTVKRKVKRTVKRKVKRTVKRKVKRKTNRFGDMIPQINTLQKYGKNFPDNQGFNVGLSFAENMTKKWGDPLLSGTVGREFGPGNVDKIYKNDYYNGIRMIQPGNDLETAISLNRTANMYNKNGNSYPVTYSPGLIYDSKNPQIVSMNAFGRRKNHSFGKKKRTSRFGGLYSQMGPVPHSNYLMDKTFFNNKYAGGGQGGPVAPNKVQNNKIFIGQSKEYSPIKSITSFGKKKVQFGSQKKKPKSHGPKEGDTISVNKFGKLKIN